jgi:P-type Cu+ transporter
MIKRFNISPSDNKSSGDSKEGKNTKEMLNEGEDDCGCCCESDTSLSAPLYPSVKSTVGKSNLEEEEREGEKNEKEKNKEAKTLITIGVTLTIPLVIVELAQFYSILKDGIVADCFLLFLATPVQILLGRPFYRRFYGSLKRKRRFGVDTLVVLSTSVAYVYSIVAIFTNQDARFFEASASVLTIFTIGNYVESRVLGITSESIKGLLSLQPKTATIIRSDGKQETVDIGDLIVGNVFIVKPGDNIATDGLVVNGESSIDESMITGESVPVDKKIGDRVIGGTTNKNGYLRIRATSVGSQTVLANIVEIVRKAKGSKPSIQRIADKCAKYFIPAVFVTALASSTYWLAIVQTPIQFGITVFATVLVVSCPCALGIATPMVISLGIGKAAKQGILLKGGKYLEKLASVDTVVFDKTGTLTKGKPEVTDIIPDDGYDEYRVIQMASSSEIKSEHPIAQAIVKRAHEKSVSLLDVCDFKAIAGQGIVAKYRQKRIFVGNPTRGRTRITDVASMGSSTSSTSSNNLQSTRIPKELESKTFELESEGKTVVAVFMDDKIMGLIAVADSLRENAVDVVRQIHLMGKETILLSGDNERTANAIAKKTGIKNVSSQVSPQGKLDKIKGLQKEKRVVAMVGDGINDAPALTRADIGIAMGSGTDVAMNAGHAILMKNDLSDIVFAFKLAKYSMKKIKQNLTISFTYNSIAISIAAGLLYGITNSLILTPALAAVGWIISDSLVFGNSLFVNRFRLNLAVEN